MKNLICLLLILAATSFAFGQKTFDVQNFSDDYYGKVYVEQPSEVFSPGWIAIYQKKTNKLLMKVKSDELAIDTENEKVKANVKEIPYGEQSVIVHEDFNFDGIKDFAIEDGQNSCYHGPSFQIYLATNVKGKFIPSPAFTKLSQEYCGMFEVDNKAKRISTMTKSGCCWHQMSEYIVVGNQPKAIKIVEENYENPFVYYDTKIWEKNKVIKTQEKSLANPEDLNVLLSFKLQNKKQVFLLNNNNSVSYNLINEKGNIELSLPLDAKNQQTNFVLDSKQDPQNLSFINGGFEYRIYENNTEISIQISGKGFSKKFPGEYASKKGSLQALANINLDNISFK